MKKSIGFLVLLGLLLCVSGSLFAATINVPGDYATIEAANVAATAGDTIVIAAGTHYVVGVAISKNLTIEGAGSNGANATIISAIGSSRVFLVTANLNLSGVAVLNGNAAAGGGLAFSGSTSTVSDCIIKDCTATSGGGGGIICADSSVVTITGSTIQDNISNDNSGGGIAVVSGSSLTMTDCIVSGNTTDSDEFGGGGVSVDVGTLTISSSTITNNTAAANGGGISSQEATLTVTSSTISDNTAAGSGGAIYDEANSTVIVASSTIADNTANGSSSATGGIHTEGTSTITNCLFYGNTSGSFSALVGEGTQNITNCTIVSNDATGANPINVFYNATGSGTVKNCIIANNGASYGVYAAVSGEVQITNCDIYNNTLGVYAEGDDPLTVYETVAELNALSYASGNIGSDPRFVSSSDYTLQSNSPCIAAATASGAPTTDRDGDTRPQGNGYDIGCYEFNTLASTWYLAEGNTGNFNEWILIQNPYTSTATVTATFYNRSGATATVTGISVPGNSRYSLNVNQALSAETEFSSTDVAAKIVAADKAAIAVSRSMYWSTDGETWAGAHTNRGHNGIANTWYLAEGSTNGFDEYILMVNPGDAMATATVTFYKEDGTTVQVADINVPATGRYTCNVNALSADLNNVSGLAAKVESTNDVPLAVERSLYWTESSADRAGDVPAENLAWTAGTCSGGTSTLSTTWFFAEGCTKTGFTEYLLLFNPNDEAATVTMTFMKDDGSTVQEIVTLPVTSRTTIKVNDISAVADSNVSVKVEATQTIAAERTILGSDWGTTSIGAAAAAPSWYLPEGSTNTGFTEYLLLLNPNSSSVTVTATYMKPDATTVEQTLTLPATSRYTLKTNDISDLADTNVAVRFVSSTAGIVVEEAMYGDVWAHCTVGSGE